MVPPNQPGDRSADNQRVGDEESAPCLRGSFVPLGVAMAEAVEAIVHAAPFMFGEVGATDPPKREMRDAMRRRVFDDWRARAMRSRRRRRVAAR